jgi:hypothetical protein
LICADSTQAEKAEKAADAPLTKTKTGRVTKPAKAAPTKKAAVSKRAAAPKKAAASKA